MDALKKIRIDVTFTMENAKRYLKAEGLFLLLSERLQ